MSSLCIENIKSVYDQFPWETRTDYRVLRKTRPDFNLPNDKVISREFGSFSSFRSMIKGEESKKKEFIPVSAKEEDSDFITKIKALLGDSFNRNEYRTFRKLNPDKNLPSCGQIDRLFGSFGNMKKMIRGEFIEEKFVAEEAEEVVESAPVVDEVVESEEEERQLEEIEVISKEVMFEEPIEDVEVEVFEETSQDVKSEIFEEPIEDVGVEVCEELSEESEESDSVVVFARKIWPNGQEFSRKEYRVTRAKYPGDQLPSCHRLEKIFGSFTSFRNIVLGKVDSSSEMQSVSSSKDWDMTPENIKIWREKVKAVRKEMFGGEREPYHWDPESRRRRGIW
jgi:hypothetical protein